MRPQPRSVARRAGAALHHSLSVRWPLGLTLLLTLGALAITAPGLVAVPDQIPGLYDSDCGLLFYANRAFFQRSIAAGDLPLWNPHDLLGYPQFAAGQTGLAYPPNYLTYPWMTTGHALFADLALHLVLLGLTTAWLARTLGLGVTGCCVAGLGVALSPMMVLRIHGGHLTVVSVMAWLPAIVAALIRAARGSRPAIAAAAVALALAVHAGHVQPLYYLAAFGLPAGVVALAIARDRRAAGRVLLALVLGSLLCALQVLPMAELARVSSRRDTSLEWTLMSSSRPVELLSLLGPEFFGDRDRVAYWGRYKIWETLPAFGFPLVLLALVALVLERSRRVVGLALFAATGVLVSMGLDLPFQALACGVIPGFGSFRAHARILLLALIAIGLLAGVATDALVARAGPRRRWLALALAVLATGLGGAAVLGHTIEPDGWQQLVDRLFTPTERFDWVSTARMLPGIRALILHVLIRAAALSCALAALVGLSSVRPLGGIGAIAILALLAAEFSDATLGLARTSPAPAISPSVQARLEARPPGSRVDFGEFVIPTLPTLAGVDSPGGSVSLMARWTQILLLGLQGRSARQATGGTMKKMLRFDGPARLLGVSLAIGDLESGFVPPGLTAENSEGPARIHATPSPWPRAWVVHRIRRADDTDAALRVLLAPGFDAGLEAVVEDPVPRIEEVVAPRPRPDAVRSPDLSPSSISPGPAGSPDSAGTPPSPKPTGAVPGLPPEPARVVGRTSGTVTLRACLDRPGVLVLAEAYDPGWSAHDATGRREVLRVDVALRGVALPAGEHTITLRYRPRTFTAALVLAILGLAGIALVLMIHRGPRQAARSPA